MELTVQLEKTELRMETTDAQADSEGWARARPNTGGRWLWREDYDRPAVELSLTKDGSEVADCGDAEEGTPQFYWEMTATSQHMMPGLWKRIEQPPVR